MVLFTITQEVQKDEKVPVARQIVKDGERQQSEMDLRRVIKDCNVDKNKSSFNRHKANRLLTADLLPNGRCLSAWSERQMGQQAFKKTDMKQAQVQSLLFAVLLAAPKTVTDLIPSSIIQRLFGSDNMNLYRGKASGGVSR